MTDSFWFRACPNLDLIFPALVCQPIRGGLYDLYDEYDNDGADVLVTDFCAVYGFAASDLLPVNKGC